MHRRPAWSLAATAISTAVFAFVSILLFAGCATPAYAHASLVAAEPADGSVAAAPPRRIALTFNEPVAPLALKLFAPDGRATILAGAVRDATLVIEIPDAAGMSGHGTYVLSWRVSSADGHPVGGSLLFSIGTPSARPAVETSGMSDPSVRAAIWAARLAIYGGLFIGIGGAVARAWAPAGPGGRSRIDRIILTCLSLGMIATTISVGLQGLDAVGAPLTSLGERIVWQTGLDTSWGMTAVVAALALLGGIVSARVRSQNRARIIALSGLIGAGLALAASGHAGTASPQLLMRPAVFLHAVGIALWIGALAPLAAALRTEGDRGAGLLDRFTRAIPLILAVVALSGLLLAVVQVARPDALWQTAYGQVLAIKLGIVALLLLVAAWNRFVLTPRIVRGDLDARRQLVRTIAIELALAVTIFAVAAGWRFTPPPRALEAAATSAAASAHIHTADAMAEVTIRPGRAGPASASIVIMTGDLGPLAAKEVTLGLGNAAAGIEPITRTAYKSRDGTWRVDDLTVPVPGRWSVRVGILVSDFQKLMLEAEIEVRP